jgi:hypothetical protein
MPSGAQRRPLGMERIVEDVLNRLTGSYVNGVTYMRPPAEL